MGADLNDHACFAPLLWVVAMLVLNVDMVTRLERGERSGALCHSFLCPGPGLCKSFLPGSGSNSPFLSGKELAWLEGQWVSDLTTKHSHGWADACVSRGGVPVHQDGLDKVVCVQGASLQGVSSDQSLGVLHRQFCSLVCLRRLCGRCPTLSRNPRTAGR